MTNATSKWIALALLGLVIAGAVAFAASRLVSEQIGIASESVSAGYDLAPAVNSATAPARTGANPEADAGGNPDTSGQSPSESTPPDSGSGENADSDQRRDEIDDLEKEREDQIEDLEKEREDREDEQRDREEDRRDD